MSNTKRSLRSYTDEEILDAIQEEYHELMQLIIEVARRRPPSTPAPPDTQQPE